MNTGDWDKCGPQQVITTGTDAAVSGFGTDGDGDGDVDVLAAS